MAIPGRHDLVIRRDQPAARRIEGARQLIEWNETRPVVARVPARSGGEAFERVVALSHGDAPGRDEADVAVDVGIAQVLLRDVEIAQGVDEFFPVARPRQLEERLQRDIIVRERGPCEGEGVAARHGIERVARHVRDHRTVARDAHVQHFIVRAFDLQRLAHGGEGERTLRREVAPGCVELLEIKVLHVRPGVGRRPGDAVIAAEHDSRHAGQRGADGVQPGRMQVREVPDAGRGEAKVRIVRQQRLAARRARAA